MARSELAAAPEVEFCDRARRVLLTVFSDICAERMAHQDGIHRVG